MANPNTPIVLATLVSQLAFIGTRVQDTGRIYVNAVDKMLGDIANVDGTTGGSPVTPCGQVWTGKSRYEPISASTYAGSTGIVLLVLDLWESQNTPFDTMWARLEGDLQTALNNLMGNPSLVQNGQAHATAIRSAPVDEYQHKQTIQLGETYYVFRQGGISIDILPFDVP